MRVRVALQMGTRLDGGMARYAQALGAALADRDDVVVIPVGSEDVLDSLHESLGSPADRLVVPKGQVAEALSVRFRLRSRLRFAADVLHGTKHLVPFRSTIPTVLTLHDMAPFDDTRFTAAKRLLLPDQYRRSIRAADRIVAVSETTRIRLAGHLPDQAARCLVVSTPAPTALLSALAEPVDELARSRAFAVYVGDLSPRKEVAFLLSIWPEVHRRSGMRLVLVGPDGWCADEAIAAVEESERAGFARRVGLVSDGQLRWLYENASVVVSASRYEGTGLPVAEAIAFGAPVVINDEPAMLETAGGRATIVPTTDRSGWVHALVGAASQSRRRSPPIGPDDPMTSAWADQMVAVYCDAATRTPA